MPNTRKQWHVDDSACTVTELEVSKASGLSGEDVYYHRRGPYSYLVFSKDLFDTKEESLRTLEARLGERIQDLSGKLVGVKTLIGELPQKEGE